MAGMGKWGWVFGDFLADGHGEFDLPGSKRGGCDPSSDSDDTGAFKFLGGCFLFCFRHVGGVGVDLLVCIDCGEAVDCEVWKVHFYSAWRVRTSGGFYGTV